MSKQEERFTIGAMPWASGLTNQGGQATVPENALWEAQNADMDSTGRLFKRPGFRKWATSLVTQPKSGLTYTETFSDLGNFSYAASGTTGQVVSQVEGTSLVFRTKAANNGTSSHTYNRAAQTNDGSAAVNTAIVNLFLRSEGTLPTQSSGTAIDAGFAVHIRTNHAFILTLLWLRTGLFYYNGTNFVLSGSETDIDDGAWHKVQIKITDAATGAATITIDDDTTNAVSITATTYTDVSVGTAQIAFSATTNSVDTYGVQVNLCQYASGNTLNAAKMRVIKDWSSVKPQGSHLIAVTEDIIYEDRNHSKSWTALTNAPSGNVLLIPWLSELIICGSNDVSRRWAGDERPILLPPAAPNDVIAGTAHQGRFFCVNEQEPLKVRYSQANNLDIWTDRVVTSNGQIVEGEASFQIPDAKGRRVTAMRGDFYGLLIIWTESSTWVFHTAGAPGIDGSLRMVAGNVGCVGPRAHDVVGKDVVFLGKDGVYNLSTVQEYGDVASASVSRNLRGLWQHNNFIDQRKIVANRDSVVLHAANEAKTYFTVQRGGQSDLNSIYVLNHDTGQWTGPYAFHEDLLTANGGGMKCLDYVTLGNQGRQFLFAASTLGDVAFMGNDRKSDYPATIDADGYPVVFRLRTSRLDGRSISKTMIRRMKRWRGIWLYILPRGGDSVTVTWNVDGEATEDSQTVSLNPYSEPLLDTTFSLGISALGDPERIGVIWVPLDVRGRWLELTITLDSDEDEDSKDIALVGFEIDATVGDEEKES